MAMDQAHDVFQRLVKSVGRRSWFVPSVFAIAVLPCHAQSTDESAADAASQQVSVKLAKPTYNNLRYEDDFSYLDGAEETYEPDIFDPIKNIHLDEDFTLSVGGEFRFRVNSFTNTAFGARAVTQDTSLEHRVFLHFDLKYRDVARVFVQGVNAEIEDNDIPLIPIEENRFDIHQGFLDLRILGEDVPLTLRIGRQELQYGAQRLISPLDWGNTRRRFDGVKLFYEAPDFGFDVFYVRPFDPIAVNIGENQNRKPDEYREEMHLYGIYSTYTGIPNHGIDGYFFALRDRGDFVNANSNAGDISLYTLGARFWGRTGPWDYDTELTGQWGRWAGDTIQAWSWSLDSGVTFDHLPWSPRLGVGFDLATGDDDPTDGKHGTFYQLFPLAHAYLGYLDLVARQNIIAQNINLTMKPAENVKAHIAWHTFWLYEESDALYNAGGVPIRRDPSGKSGSDVANELDITVAWQIDTHQSILLGYSHIWNNNFIRQTGASEDPDFIYLMYKFRF